MMQTAQLQFVALGPVTASLPSLFNTPSKSTLRTKYAAAANTTHTCRELLPPPHLLRSHRRRKHQLRTMHLLERNDEGNIGLTSFDDDKVPPYAILSHRWDREEVLFQDIKSGTAKDKVGYRKIQFCVDQAWSDGLRFCWVDTCCIDKTSSAELQTAINRMFRWYRYAIRCYVYLADILSTSTQRTPFCTSKWFTRGWTL